MLRQFDDDRGGQLDLVVIHRLLQPLERTEIPDPAVRHEHDPVGPDAQDILDAVLDHQDGHAFIRQAADHVEGFIG